VGRRRCRGGKAEAGRQEAEDHAVEAEKRHRALPDHLASPVVAIE
jgi:hypothetical protein